MNIAGVVVHSRPEECGVVEQRLMQLPGVEVHAISEKGRMVVTVESASEHEVADLVTAMQGFAGVLSAAMVYHSFNESMDEEEALP